jgi:hypothetical protein
MIAALGAPPRQVQPAVVNPFARAAKKAKLDLLPKGRIAHFPAPEATIGLHFDFG